MSLLAARLKWANHRQRRGKINPEFDTWNSSGLGLRWSKPPYGLRSGAEAAVAESDRIPITADWFAP